MTETTALKAALREMLSDWRKDLSPEWHNLLNGVELGFDDMDPELTLHPWEPIFPARRRSPLPGAPQGAHMFRAFDDLRPDAVRCLVVGQDPYPSISFCTGRAFESGEHRHWRELEKMRSSSMRNLLQCVYAVRSAGDIETTRDWQATIRAIERSVADFPSPSQLVDEWVSQGVLLLNASLTLSRFSVAGDPHQILGHLPLWRPLTAHLVRYFLSRERPRVVCVLFGSAAREAAVAAGVLNERDDQHPQLVILPHPAEEDAFLGRPNPLLACNQKLEALGEKPIQW